MDKNNNQIPDKVEGYALLIVSIVLVVAGLVFVGMEIFTDSFGQWIITVGMLGLIGDEVVKKYFTGG
jgi:pheromone shutdown protein TraB